MKKILVVALLAVCVVVMMASCASSKLGEVGKLPKNWWTLSRGEVQNELRKNSTGYYSQVIAIVGHSDDFGCASESDAIALAKLDADTLLSQYIIQKTYDIMVNKSETVTSNMTDAQKTEVSRMINSVTESMRSSMSMAEFSSYIVEGSHVEAAERYGIQYYKGWVLCTVQDEIIEKLRDLQQKAFEAIMEAATEYKDVMVKIEAESMQALSDSFKSDLGQSIVSEPAATTNAQ